MQQVQLIKWFAFRFVVLSEHDIDYFSVTVVISYIRVYGSNWWWMEILKLSEHLSYVQMIDAKLL